MRSNSLAGTRPAEDQRLGAAAERAVAARARAPRPAAGGASFSSRISARPGPTYQSAWAISSVWLVSHFLDPGLDFCDGSAVLYPARTVGTSEAVTACWNAPLCKYRQQPAPATVMTAPAGAVRRAGRRDHGRLAVAHGAGAVARRLRPRRLVLLALFALTLPWMVIGFWNAVIGFLIMRFAPIRSRP